MSTNNLLNKLRAELKSGRLSEHQEKLLIECVSKLKESEQHQNSGKLSFEEKLELIAKIISIIEILQISTGTG